MIGVCMADELGERVARLEAQMEPLLEVPQALGRLEGKVDQILINRNGRHGMSLIGTIITVFSSAFVALLVVILTHVLGKP